MNESTDQMMPGKSKRLPFSDTFTDVNVIQPEKPTPDVTKATANPVVQVKNKRNRLIELDFGRDREIRILPFGETEIPEAYLKHPEFVREQANLVVSKVR